jgi:hypothetical protein
MTVAAANIAGFWGNRRMDPESIAGEDAGAPGIFNRWTASFSPGVWPESPNPYIRAKERIFFALTCSD